MSEDPHEPSSRSDVEAAQESGSQTAVVVAADSDSELPGEIPIETASDPATGIPQDVDSSPQELLEGDLAIQQPAASDLDTTSLDEPDLATPDTDESDPDSEIGPALVAEPKPLPPILPLCLPPIRRVVAAAFDSDLHLLLLASALTRILQGYLGAKQIHFALVGDDPGLTARLYHFLDFGLRPVGIFCGGSDMVFAAQGLDELPSEGVDLVVLSDRDPIREEALLAQLRARANAGSVGWRVVRLARLLDAHRDAMDVLRPEAFSTCLSPTKLAALTCAAGLSAAQGVSVEAGVFLGGSTIYVSKLQQQLGLERRQYAFDTFEGIPAPTEPDGDTPFVAGLFSQGTLETVRRNYAAHAIDDIELVKGLVQETLPEAIPKDQQVAFALIDLDQYAGTRAALDVVVPKLHRRGIIAVDDADGAGVDAAIRETLALHPELIRCNVSTGFDLLLHRDQPGVLSEVRTDGELRVLPTSRFVDAAWRVPGAAIPTTEEVLVAALRGSAETQRAFTRDPQAIPSLARFVDAAVATLTGGGHLMACGNGGSMSDAMHFTEEWTGRFRRDRRALPAMAFSDPAQLSCIANDFGYEEVFARQVEAHGRPGDLLVLISTSGNSPNLIRASEEARLRGVTTVALLGRGGGKLLDRVDIPILVPLATTADRIQEVHIQILHAAIEAVERRMFPELYL